MQIGARFPSGGVYYLLLAMALRAGAAQAQQSQPATEPATEPTSRPAQSETPAKATAKNEDWVDKIKHPVPWFKWGADFRMREEYMVNQFTLSKELPNSDWNVQRYRPRVWMTLSPDPDLDVNLRMTNEGRHHCKPDSKPEWDYNEVIFDNLNVKWKLPGIPATVTVGRQDLILGDGWLVLEGTPLDGSRAIYFDAARFNLDLKDIHTTADVIYIQQYADQDRWLHPINSTHYPMIEQDEQGAIVYLSNKSIDKTQVDGYFIYKHDQLVLTNGDDGDIYTFGTRLSHEFTKHIQARAEGAGQFGIRNGVPVCAGGLNSRLTYSFNDPWKNQLKLNYEFLSGDDPNTKKNEAFDPLWGRWPQWSELYLYTWATETRVGEATNLHRLGFGWQSDPTPKLQLLADYHLLFADENTYRGRDGFSDGGGFRGQLLTAITRYKFNRFLSGNLVGEWFFPGNYYADPRTDTAMYLRAELAFTF